MCAHTYLYLKNPLSICSSKILPANTTSDRLSASVQFLWMHYTDSYKYFMNLRLGPEAKRNRKLKCFVWGQILECEEHSSI